MAEEPKTTTTTTTKTPAGTITTTGGGGLRAPDQKTPEHVKKEKAEDKAKEEQDSELMSIKIESEKETGIPIRFEKTERSGENFETSRMRSSTGSPGPNLPRADVEISDEAKLHRMNKEREERGEEPYETLPEEHKSKATREIEAREARESREAKESRESSKELAHK